MNKTISLVILASAALHAAVLGLVDFNSPTEINAAGSLMRISILAPSPSAAEAVKKSNNVKQTPNVTNKITKTAGIQKKKVIKNTPKEAEPPKSLDAQQHSNPPQQTSRTITAKLESDSTPIIHTLSESTASLLHSDLERAFALHFYYPRIAIKRGWQGEVKISLRIEADGHLTRVRVLNSSGYTLLDKAAIASIDKVEILPAAIALLDGQSLDLVLPVEYRLL